MTPPRRLPSAMPYAVIGILLAALMFGVALFTWFGGSSQAAIGGPFTLKDAKDQTVTDRNFRGKFMLVYFGYTYCPDVCPTTLQSIANAMDKLGPKADQIVPIFITVDPWRDTPAVVGRYAAAFSQRLVGLTGTRAEVGKAEKEYHVYAAKHDAGNGEYSMDHSSVIYLMGKDGQFIAPVAEGPPQQMADDIIRLMASG